MFSVETFENVDWIVFPSSYPPTTLQSQWRSCCYEFTSNDNSQTRSCDGTSWRTNVCLCNPVGLKTDAILLLDILWRLFFSAECHVQCKKLTHWISNVIMQARKYQGPNVLYFMRQAPRALEFLIHTDIHTHGIVRACHILRRKRMGCKIKSL